MQLDHLRPELSCCGRGLAAYFFAAPASEGFSDAPAFQRFECPFGDVEDVLLNVFRQAVHDGDELSHLCRQAGTLRWVNGAILPDQSDIARDSRRNG
jgi:hypothetical protein